MKHILPGMTPGTTNMSIFKAVKRIKKLSYTKNRKDIFKKRKKKEKRKKSYCAYFITNNTIMLGGPS